MSSKSPRSIRGPEDVEEEIRDEMCGAVTRKVTAAAGRACNVRTTEEIVEQLENVDGCRVDRWEEAEERFDDRDFIDLSMFAGGSHSRMLLICQRNGFTLEAIAGNWERQQKELDDTNVVFQWKR